MVDCREGEAARAEAAGADCSGERAGNLYIQYWTYYADSATLRGVPVAGEKGYHARRLGERPVPRSGPDGSVDERASSHHGYNYVRGRDRQLGISRRRHRRRTDGWGPETRLLLVSGGSHAGNAVGIAPTSTASPPAAASTWSRSSRSPPPAPPRFAISPPWLKHVWRDPEAEGTD